MDYKDIEEKLKADAVKQERKDFSVRWNKLQAQLESENNAEGKEYVYNPVPAPAGAVSESPIKFNINKKLSLIITTIAVALITLILAIMLPIILKRNDDTVYFDEEQLTYSYVEKDDFYSGVDGIGLNLIDLSDYDVQSYRLYLADSDSVKGGAFELFDENLGCYAVVRFYDKSVKINEDLSNQYETKKINGTDVNYKTEQADGFFSVSVTFVFKEVYYRMTCTTIEDNYFELLEKLLT